MRKQYIFFARDLPTASRWSYPCCMECLERIDITHATDHLLIHQCIFDVACAFIPNMFRKQYAQSFLIERIGKMGKWTAPHFPESESSRIDESERKSAFKDDRDMLMLVRMLQVGRKKRAAHAERDIDHTVRSLDDQLFSVAAKARNDTALTQHFFNLWGERVANVFAMKMHLAYLFSEVLFLERSSE